jgi:hypothetical protein
MYALQRNRKEKMGRAALVVSLLGLLVGPSWASNWEEDAEKLCSGWGDQADKRRYCVNSVTTCLLYRETETRKAHFAPCMQKKKDDLPPGTEWRAVLAGEGGEGKEILHGSYMYGELRCDPGYYRNTAGDNCLPLPEVAGGRWKNNALYCNSGYVKMIDGEPGAEVPPDKLSCRKLPEIPNAVYNWSNPTCTSGYVMVEGPRCVPRSSVKDRSEILSSAAWQRYMCPEGYRASGGECYYTGLKAKSASAGEMELQGLRLGMAESEVGTTLKANGYSEMSYGFVMTEPNGTKKTIEYKVGVPGSKEAQYRRLVRINYKQEFPTSLRFDLAEVEAKMKDRFGEPDEQAKKSAKEFSLAYKDGGRSSQSDPVLYINARKDFRGQFLMMSLQDPGLQQRLQQDHRAAVEAKKRKAELAKPAASIDF